ncbi:prolyl oligopeptidase family serine peptidase [Mycetocola zhadangensis]|uniref:prolyl oligopeptidase family serine peptidase n=1 Tax=Mycetocola zhadangensis TaxID=1164595 RepID=UPI001983C1F3|nr:prolyl oligopeptidase family serine peptidase [Mycetocola zhadangensis]GGF02178.1 prolyl oligopeptidase [Mycetocola zhadangensis]
MTEAPDPYSWLENVDGGAALDWVRARNAVTEATLAATPEFAQTEAAVLSVLDSDAKIPMVQKIGEFYYNFWRDAEHERGLWRRTTLEQYRAVDPEWQTVLDLDALNAAEGENWVWHGASVLRPGYRKALIDLSHGGSDADVTREFDLETLSFVEPEDGGFFRPESKGSLGWIDDDTVYLCSAQGEGSATSSGYPRIAKRWRRGTPIDSAEVVFEGKTTDVSVGAFRSHTPGYLRDFVHRATTFYTSDTWVDVDGTLTKIDVPASAEIGFSREWLLIELRNDWELNGATYAAGSLLSANFDAFVAGDRRVEVVFEPTPTTSLAGATWTRNHLVITVLEDVKSRIHVLERADATWQRNEFAGAPEFGTVQVAAVDTDESDLVWLIATDYLTPTTLSLAVVGAAVGAAAGQPEELKSQPAFFDAAGLTIEQYFARSDDGTRVPYFVVRREDLPFDGTARTLLYGYGGFEVSLTPGYSGSLGLAWLKQGGVYVVANIRGGGEYGPIWHQAALRENRHRAFEDFAAVARDLVTRGVTSASHLGIQGGSNGGLLTGNMLAQYPELFGAVIIQVPLLDMKRYSYLLAGASWIAEYGDPDDPADWEFLRTFSPYHLFDPKREYPPVLFTTSTRDDRVHPGHARKLAARMIDAGKDVTYFENIEGGHGGAATNAQAAHMSALAYRFLAERLG